VARLVAFLEGGEANALILTGGPGIGKTTLWEAGVELAREPGCASFPHARAAPRRSSQLQALEAALLRTPGPGVPPAASSVGVGS
jgi:hypothetical protein